MTRISYLSAVVCALLAVALPSRADDCRRRTTGDICASGSPWSDFTRFRVQLRGEERAGTTTMTTHGAQDFSLEVEDSPAAHGTIIVIAGRAMLMRDVPHESGYEIDALDGPVLMHQLVTTLLDQAFPKGPQSLGASHQIEIVQKSRPISIATASASGRLEAPWTLMGTARRAGDKIEYDLRFDFTARGAVKSLGFTGFWEKAPAAPPLDEHMSLDGWTVHWLTPMTSSSDKGTALDYGAQPVSEHWADLTALRKYIAEEPARRARRRMPADAANPGRTETFSYEAFAVDKHGARKRLGQSVREYRPGTDIVVEQTQPMAWTKTLALDYGLSLSAAVYREPELRGFGLVLAKDDSSGLGWEWFNREGGDVFRKLLGGGRVRVSVLKSDGYQELVAVEFLDEIALQCTDEQSGIGHEVRVRKGSVFKVMP